MKRGLTSRIRRIERAVLPPRESVHQALDRLLEETVGWDPNAWDLLHAAIDAGDPEVNPDALPKWKAVFDRMADCAEAQDKKKMARA